MGSRGVGVFFFVNYVNCLVSFSYLHLQFLILVVTALFVSALMISDQKRVKFAGKKVTEVVSG